MKSLDYMQHPIGGAANAPLIANTTVTVAGDSATIVGKRGDSTVVNRKVAVSRGAMPTLPSSYLKSL